MNERCKVCGGHTDIVGVAPYGLCHDCQKMAADNIVQFRGERDAAERGCKVLRLELEVARGENATLRNTVEALQGAAESVAEELEAMRAVHEPLLIQRDRFAGQCDVLDADLREARAERDMLREALAGSEAALAKTREMLEAIHKNRIDDDGGACACLACSQCLSRAALVALSTSPSAALAEREAGLKARIAQLEKAAEANLEVAEKAADAAGHAADERDAAMAKAAMLREALVRFVEKPTPSHAWAARREEAPNVARAALADSTDVSAWLSERLKQEREATERSARATICRLLPGQATALINDFLREWGFSP